jgi:hypothetical protein
VLTTTAKVVVVSRDDDDLTTTAHLAVVPFSNGELVVRRPVGSRADVRVRLHDGSVAESTIPVVEGTITIPLATEIGHQLVEVVEVTFGS